MLFTSVVDLVILGSNNETLGYNLFATSFWMVESRNGDSHLHMSMWKSFISGAQFLLI